MKVTLLYERVEGAAPGVNRFVCPALEADELGGSVSGRIWFRDPLGTNAVMLRVTIEEISAEDLAGLKTSEENDAPQGLPPETTPPGEPPPAPEGEGVATDGDEGAASTDQVTPPAGDVAPPAEVAPQPEASTVPEGSSPTD